MSINYIIHALGDIATDPEGPKRTLAITAAGLVGVLAPLGCGAGGATTSTTTYMPQGAPETSALAVDMDEGVVTWAAEQTWLTTGASGRAAMCFLWTRDPARALRALDQPEFEEAFARILNREY